MLNRSKNAWVKNVYSPWIDNSKTSEHLSPILQSIQANTTRQVHKYVIIPRLPQSFTSFISTIKNSKLPLLLSSYTHFPQDLIIETQKINLKTLNNKEMELR